MLRDGVVVGSALTTREVTEQEVARRMLGRDVATLAQRPTAPQSMPMVAVRGLAGDAVRSVDLTVGKGEVLGITGLPGSGFESIPYLLAAARQIAGLASVVGEVLRRGVLVEQCAIGVPHRDNRDVGGAALRVVQESRDMAMVQSGDGDAQGFHVLILRPGGKRRSDDEGWHRRNQRELNGRHY